MTRQHRKSPEGVVLGVLSRNYIMNKINRRLVVPGRLVDVNDVHETRSKLEGCSTRDHAIWIGNRLVIIDSTERVELVCSGSHGKK